MRKETPVYTMLQIWLAALIAHPLASGWLLRKNYLTFGYPERARLSVYFAVLISLFSLGLGLTVPDMPVLQVPPILLGLFWAQRDQQRLIEAHLARGGEKASVWSVTQVSLYAVFIVLSLAIVLSPFFEPGPLPKEEFAYSDSLTLTLEGSTLEEDGKNFGDFITTHMGYFPKDVRFGFERQEEIIVGKVIFPERTSLTEVELTSFREVAELFFDSKAWSSPKEKRSFVLFDESRGTVFREFTAEVNNFEQAPPKPLHVSLPLS